LNGNYSTAIETGDVFGKLKVKQLLSGKKLFDQNDDDDTESIQLLQDLSLEATFGGNFTGVELKNGRAGPDISVFGTGDLKSVYMVQVMIKKRPLYTITAAPSDKHKHLKAGF